VSCASVHVCGSVRVCGTEATIINIIEERMDVGFGFSPTRGSTTRVFLHRCLESGVGTG